MTATNVGVIRSYWELGKPRLSMMAVFAVVAGAYMAWPSRSSGPPLDLLVVTTLGTFLAAIGAAALNMYRERDLDVLMHRTQDRPLPTGRLSPRNVLVFGAIASVLGVLLVLFGAAPLAGDGSRTPGEWNWPAASLCALIVISYVLVYTPMKTRTPLNTLVGAIPGALPPVVGHAAVAGDFVPGQLVLFTILFFWQIPHFLAIAWRYREDYARAGMQMLPVVDPTGHRTGITMLLYVGGLGIASLLPYVTHMDRATRIRKHTQAEKLFFIRVFGNRESFIIGPIFLDCFFNAPRFIEKIFFGHFYLSLLRFSR